MLLALLIAALACFPHVGAKRDGYELSAAAGESNATVKTHDYGGLSAEFTSLGPLRPRVCQQVAGAVPRNTEDFPRCKCAASDHYVVCGGAKVDRRKFDALDVFSTPGCERPRCASSPSSCAQIEGAKPQNSGEYPACKCKADDETVFCGGRSVAGRKFDAAAVLSKAECRQPRCAKERTCEHIPGAESCNSKAYPFCKCKVWYQEVFVNGAKVADRRFNADQVLNRHATPYCDGTEATLTRARIGHCVNPGDGLLASSGELWGQVVEPKIQSVAEGATLVDAWRQNPFGSGLLPSHPIVGLVRDDAKYGADQPIDSSMLDAECFQFDYDSADAPDPSGCRLFAASFQPLQKLRNCIAEELVQDEMWITRKEKVVEDGAFKGPYDEWCRQAVWAKTLGVPAKLCNLHGTFFDTNRRAEEMMKYTLFQREVKPEDLPAYLLRKIQMTITWPRGQPSLEEATASAISARCYKVEPGGDSPQYSHFFKLQNIGSCQPLMYDKVEIAGMGLADSGAKWSSEDYFQKQGDDKDFKQWTTLLVPSVCGRMALAAIAPFQIAKYSIVTASTLANDKLPTWEGCANVQSTNCRKFYFCWEKALQKVCKDVSSRCCWEGV